MFNAKILLLPLIALLSVACRKNEPQEYEYGIVCNFPAIMGDSSLLVITDQAGEVVKEFPLASGSTELSKRFTFWASDSPGFLSAHLIRRGYSLNGALSQANITSHVGIPETGLMKFSPDVMPSSAPTTFLRVIISGVDQSVNRVNRGDRPVSSDNQPPGRVVCFMPITPNEGLYLRAFGSKETRDIFVPEVNSTDSLLLHWSQFAPEGPQQLSLKHPVIPWASFYSSIRYKVRAVSPTGDRFVLLAEDVHNSLEPTVQCKLPTHLDSTWRLHILAKNDFFQSTQVFESKSSLQISAPSMRIVEADDHDGGKSIKLRHTGNADMLRATAKYATPSASTVEWRIDARPNLFENLRIPNLDKYLPHGAYSHDIFRNHFVSEAFRSETYDYPDMVQGYPWRLLNPFLLHEGGYEWIRVY